MQSSGYSTRSFSLLPLRVAVFVLTGVVSGEVSGVSNGVEVAPSSPKLASAFPFERVAYGEPRGDFDCVDLPLPFGVEVEGEASFTSLLELFNSLFGVFLARLFVGVVEIVV